ncbi:MAG TPA: methyltransferase domain-containing protein [Tabrizicola sp.]|nr:methyltransferase domain-containing protein [Tabrizicola sp.]
MPPISDRLRHAVEALPLSDGLRVLEIGCGPGVAARAVAARIGSGKVVAIDRSPTAIAQATRGSGAEIASGLLEFRCVSIEDFELEKDEPPFDLAYAHRVGALDGRHDGTRARAALRRVLKPGGLLVIDDGPPIRVEDLDA